MNAKELRSRSTEDLEKTLGEQRELLRTLRFNITTSQESRVRKLRVTKKTIARILTLLKENSPST